MFSASSRLLVNYDPMQTFRNLSIKSYLRWRTEALRDGTAGCHHFHYVQTNQSMRQVPVILGRSHHGDVCLAVHFFTFSMILFTCGCYKKG